MNNGLFKELISTIVNNVDHEHNDLNESPSRIIYSYHSGSADFYYYNKSREHMNWIDGLREEGFKLSWRHYGYSITIDSLKELNELIDHFVSIKCEISHLYRCMNFAIDLNHPSSIKETTQLLKTLIDMKVIND